MSAFFFDIFCTVPIFAACRTILRSFLRILGRSTCTSTAGANYYDAHDFYQEIVPKRIKSHFVRAFLLPAMARIERWTARRCDAVVTVSAGVAAALAETIGVNATVIRNAVNFAQQP